MTDNLLDALFVISIALLWLGFCLLPIATAVALISLAF